MAAAQAVPASAYPDAADSDPVKLGWMVGSPPPANRILRFEDGSYFQFPAMRWSVAHFRELMPTVNVSRGLRPAAPLPRALRDDIDGLEFKRLDTGETMRWRDALAANYTDGMVVL
ncbi:MAG: 6-aminohexanoate hydrolase, partial [Comamonas sp.]